MSCSPEPDENLDKAISRVARGGRARRAGRLPAGAVSDAVLLPARGHALFDLAEPIPGPEHASDWLRWRAKNGVVVIASLFERRAAGALSQHGGDLRRATARCRPVSQDAHPRRSALLRKVLLHAGRSGLPGASTPAFGRVGHAGLLGPVVSGRRAAHRAAGRERAVLSHGDRLASGGEGRVRRGAARCVAERSSARTRSPTAFMSRR